MSKLSCENPIRMAIIQRVCTGYRVPLFSQLSARTDIEVTLFIGHDVPRSKVKSSSGLLDIDYRKLNTRFVRLGSRILPWHIGLIAEFRKLKPDVILCEGESHFIGYLQAILYKYFFNRRVALMHWCFISLPGWSAIGGVGFRALIKIFFRRFFDAFVVYSSFSKKCLLKLGQPSDKVFVATNVSDTKGFLNLSDAMTESVSEARKKLKLPERFTVLYLGTLDANKRPDMMLDLAKESDNECYNFVLLGSGPLFEELHERVAREHLSSVFLPGRVVDDLPFYFRAADVLMLPGRGGMVMSEAMAWGLPVIVHQADGTEYDLVQDGVTGFHLQSGNLNDFRKALEQLQSNPGLCEKMGSESRRLVKSRFTTENMVNQIVSAAQYAKKARNERIDNT